MVTQEHKRSKYLSIAKFNFRVVVMNLLLFGQNGQFQNLTNSKISYRIL